VPDPVRFGSIGKRIFSNYEGKTDPGEQNCSPIVGGASLLLRLDVRDTGILEVDTVGSLIDTVLSIRRINGDDWTDLPCLDSVSNGKESKLLVPIAKTSSYSSLIVVVDGVRGTKGCIQLNWCLGAVPVISVPPHDMALPAGQMATFEVSVTNENASLSYQWFKEDRPLAGATNRSLVLPQLRLSDTGQYHVVVSNLFGAIVSAPAKLTVLGFEFRAFGLNANQQFELTFPAELNQKYWIETSTNLITWSTNGPMPIATNIVTFVDLAAPNCPWRFYRVRLQRE
jgi:hypothetical protein